MASKKELQIAKVIKLYEKQFFVKNPVWPLVGGPVPGLEFKGLRKEN